MMKIFVFILAVLISISAFIFSANQAEQYLPIGRSTFSRIIKDECSYVDKIDHIYRLLKSGQRYFFIARPRQFGRTLFLTTLEDIFEGKKDLFKKTALAKSDYSWQLSPVIVLDFCGTGTHNKQKFEQYLCRYVQRIAQRYSITLINEKGFAGQFKELVLELAKQYGSHNVVLLIDEYDKPMLDRIDSDDQYGEIEGVLKTLYDVIGECDSCWRYVFFTGLTKCSKHVVLAGIPSVFDISENDDYAELFGFSKKELLNVFKPKLLAYAQSLGQSLDKVVDLITSWCGGYNFSCQIQGDGQINPRSVLYHLQDRKADNYFFDGCTPSFLVKILKQKKYSFELPCTVRVKKENFEAYDQQTILPEIALYAAGYLTLCGFDKTNDEYLLKIPNKETKQAFQFLKTALQLAKEQNNLI